MTELTIYPEPNWIDRIYRAIAPNPSARCEPQNEFHTTQNNLIEAIETGFIVDETGATANVPTLARAHFKTLVKIGDV